MDVEEVLIAFQRRLFEQRNRSITCQVCGNQHTWAIPHEQKDSETLNIHCGHCGAHINFNIEQMQRFLQIDFALPNGEGRIR